MDCRDTVMNMKRLLLAMVILLAAACGSEGNATVTTATTEVDSVQPPVTDSSTVDLIRAADPSFEVVSDYLLMDLVGAICEAFDLGLGPDAVLESSEGSGITPSQVGVLVGAAVALECPRHAEMLESWAATDGGL